MMSTEACVEDDQTIRNLGNDSVKSTSLALMLVRSMPSLLGCVSFSLEGRGNERDSTIVCNEYKISFSVALMLVFAMD